jgi:hypothetical protein
MSPFALPFCGACGRVGGRVEVDAAGPPEKPGDVEPKRVLRSPARESGGRSPQVGGMCEAADEEPGGGYEADEWGIGGREKVGTEESNPDDDASP